MKDALAQTSSRTSKLTTRIEKKLVLLIFALAISWSILVFNSMRLGSSELGIALSVVFFVALAIVCGMGFYDEDGLVSKAVKGWFTVFVLIAIMGSLLLYVNAFNVFNGTLMMTFIVTVLVLVVLFKKLRSDPVASKSTVEKAQYSALRWPEVVLSSLVALGVCTSFYVLWTSRTQEPMFDVWFTISPLRFFPLIFLSVFTLGYLIFFRKGSSLHLGLIIAIAFLFVSIYYVVWYPSLYGDPLSQLGTARFTARTGSILARDYLLSNGFWIDIIKYRGYYSVVVTLTRLLDFDIYWVHNIFTPLIWSVALPFSTYAVTCLLANKPLKAYPKEALLAAFSGIVLFRWLIAWGADPTPNALSFLFLFFTVPLILLWAIKGGKGTFALAILGTAAAFMTHPFPGIFASIFLFNAAVFRKVKWTLPKVVAIAASVLLYPAIFAYGQGLNLQGFLSIQNLIEFEGTLLTVPFVFAAAGVLLSWRESMNRRILSLLLTFYIIGVVEYYISRFSGLDTGFGASRVLAILDFLLIPFVGVCLGFLPRVVAQAKLPGAVATKMPRLGSINLKTVASVALILLISLQSIVTLYQAYPRNEVGLAPTAYEAEAIQYINATAPRRFVVLSDTLFTNLAIGLLGEDYSYIGLLGGGAFGVPVWDYPIQQYYVNMVNDIRGQLWDESFSVLRGALDFASAQTVYFVVSTRLSDFDDVTVKTSQILQTDKIFGGGKLYIFKYPTLISRGAGPIVKVTYEDGGVEEVQSEFSYATKSEVTYSLRLSGHTDYNITDYPMNWAFKLLTVNLAPADFDNSSDITSFIVLKGLNPIDRISVTWVANDNYPLAKWKEDSFKEGWGPYPGYSYKINPLINTDGNIVTLSWNFTKGDVQDYYYAKPISVSTDDNTYAILRWKSTAGIAVSAIYYSESGAPDTVKVQEIVTIGSRSDTWITSVVKLPPSVTINYAMVGISNLVNQDITGVQTLFVDYFLISAQA